MGTTNANGIYFYEDTDAVSPLHTLLNTGQTSVSNALTTFRGRTRVIANRAARPTDATRVDGLLVKEVDTKAIYQWDAAGGTWRLVALPPITTSEGDFYNPAYAWSITGGSLAGATDAPGLIQTLPSVPEGAYVRARVGIPALDIGASSAGNVFLERSVNGAPGVIFDGANYSLAGGAFGSVPITLVDNYRVPPGAPVSVVYKVRAYKVGTAVVRAADGAFPVTMNVQVFA